MRIAVVGARLAGSYASLILSRLGHEVLLFDPNIRREKPCGGGVTAKALRTIPWFHEHSPPHSVIDSVRLCIRRGRSSVLRLTNPIHIFSRATLDTALRNSALQAGTSFIPERALRFLPHRAGWVIQTGQNAYEADFLVGADGATSTVRAALSEKYSSVDLSLAMGYYLPGEYHRDTVIAVLQENGFQGYLWSFPRLDHSSVGILRWLPESKASDLRQRVLDFIDLQYPEAGQDKQFYAARIPCLSRQSLIKQRVCGKNWALLGDAAGFADAITAEGIYFALRSAEILGEALERGEPLSYEPGWRKDFGMDLQRAASWRDRFYGGKLLFRAFAHRVLQINCASPRVQQITDMLVAGTTTYRQLRRQLIASSPRILLDAILSKFHKLVAVKSWHEPRIR